MQRPTPNGADDKQAARGFELLDEVHLRIVAQVAEAQGIFQSGETAVDEPWQTDLAQGLAKAALLRQHHHATVVAVGQGATHRNGVAHAAVDVETPVDTAHRAQHGQRARGAHHSRKPFEIRHFFEILGLAGLGISGRGHKTHARIAIRFKIKRIVALRIFVEKKIEVDDASAGKEMPQPDVGPERKQVDVAEARAAALPRHERHAHARTGRSAYDIRKCDTRIDEAIQHARRERAAHSAAFEDERRIILCFLIGHKLQAFCAVSACATKVYGSRTARLGYTTSRARFCRRTFRQSSGTATSPAPCPAQIRRPSRNA